jgi:hypothetical protein
MRTHCRFVLPIIGLFLFAGVTYDSLHMNHEVKDDRYFWWSSIRLNSDPLNRRPANNACKVENGGCLGPVYIWVDPGWLTKSLMLSACPTFLVSAIAVGALARLGVNEITTFMISMPPLIVAWYYFLGWLVDRWRNKPRPQPNLSTL